MGRESRVRGVPFFNGEIAASLAIEAVGYRLSLRQERVFTNRFGQRIFEDILHFQKPGPHPPAVDAAAAARSVAASALQAGLEHAMESDIKADLLDAIEKVKEISPSPRYAPKPTTSPEKANAISHTAPRKTARHPRERQVTGQR
jgi:hypothetical protein